MFAQTQWLRVLLQLAFCLFLSASCLAQGQDQEPKPIVPDTYTAPMVMLENRSHAYVRVTQDKGGSIFLMLDTGSPNCILDREVARKLKLPIKKGKDVNNGDVEYVNTSIAVEPDVLKLNGAAFLLSDMSLLRQENPEFAGILGIDALQNFAVFLSFSERAIRFYYPGNLNLVKKEGDGIHRIPLIKKDYHYHVEGKIDDKPVRLLVDTGGESTSLGSSTLLSQLKPVATLDGGKSAVVSPTGNRWRMVSTRAFRLRRLTIEGAEWKDPIVTQKVMDTRQRPDILGLDFLRRYLVFLDFPGRMLYLVADPRYKEDPSDYVGTGLWYDAAIGKSLVIDHIRKPSPAQEAGVAAGDEIIEINGEAIKPETVTWAFYKKILSLDRIIGTEMTYKVKRKGEKQPLSFTLKTRKLL